MPSNIRAYIAKSVNRMAPHNAWLQFLDTGEVVPMKKLSMDKPEGFVMAVHPMEDREFNGVPCFSVLVEFIPENDPIVDTIPNGECGLRFTRSGVELI